MEVEACEQIDQVDSAVSRFAQTHAAQIQEAQLEWRAVELSASDLGFDSQVVPTKPQS